MPECDYCEASFDDEDAYLDHLRGAHGDELGPIDRRRIDTEPSSGLPSGPIAVGLVVLAAAAVVGYVIFLPGAGGDGPTDVGAIHYHGTMSVVIDDRAVDFSQPQYQVRNTGVEAFHYEADDGTRWHVHARGVTLAWALDSLGIGVTSETVSIEGTTYDAADPGTEVSVTVNGAPVTPAGYVLREGDAVRVVVTVD